MEGKGTLWAKLSGTDGLGATALDYEPAPPFHDALVATKPERPVWGTDWPHPRPEGPVPDAARLLTLFLDWTPEPARGLIRTRNPEALYGFPPAEETEP